MEVFDTYMINKMFTVPYLDKMISGNSIPELLHQCKRYIKTEEATVGRAISEIYHFMDGNYRNEYFYKNTILNQLMIQKHDLYSTAALTELPIGESKADFIMINGRGVVYEIKTDLDNLNRLESQIHDYYKVFSYVCVVTGSKQLQHVKECLKESKAGIYELTAKGKLICRKQALCNRQYLSHEAMFRVLRKGEFESVLLKHYGKLPEVNSFLYYRECQKWIEKINIVTLQKDVMDCLKARTLLLVGNKLDELIPYELRFYAYFSKKYKAKYEGINTFCTERMEG
ncbi:MAG: sce7726 family protein [Lachnospiraceae bacterium]|nr:sce7726 family protein [Lachnospiraceae bacterium]